MKIQDRILEILVTALLESIDLFIAVFNAHDSLIQVRHISMSGVKPTLTRTKSDPNDPDNLDDLTLLHR